jgi:quercetin dioxygenase-like cupin family protein
MESVRFESAESYEPDTDWRRVALAGSDRFSFEWFEKPPGHSSPTHDHANEQVCMVIAGELTVYTGEEDSENGGSGGKSGQESVTLGPYDSVWLESWESHRVENTGDERAVGLDVFSPGRSFDFWTDRDDEETSENGNANAGRSTGGE